jgi:hypothetical protein
MSALDVSGKTRMDLAKEAASHAIEALSPGADAMILQAGREPLVASPLDRDARRLKSAIALTSASDAEGDLEPSLALAVDRLRQLGGERRILVFTDGALANEDSFSSVGLPLEVVRVGSPVDNAGIVLVDLRSGIDPVLKTEQVQAFLMTANYGTRPRDLFVTMREKGASDVLASRRILVKPGERVPVILTFNPAPGDIGQGLVFELSPHDAMVADDLAYARVPPGARLQVVVASTSKTGSAWLERALLSDSYVELLRASSTNLSAVGIPQGALVVADGFCPSQAPPGDLLVVNPPQGGCLGLTVGNSVDSPAITSWANADQRFRFLTLDGVFIAKAHLLGTDGPRNDLVHAREGVLVADISTPGRTSTLIGFDVGESNWPFKASFVLFMRNLVELARAHRANDVAGSNRAAEPIKLAVPAEISKIELVAPDETKTDVLARNGLAVVADTQKAGIYHASWDGPRPGQVAFAVNLASERESNLTDRPLKLNSNAATVSAGKDLADAHAEWSWLLAAIALAFITFDVWYLTRRARVITTTEPLKPRLPERRPS